MPYYPTIEEDLNRAKQILAKGKPDAEEMAAFDALPLEIKQCLAAGGTIFGADIYPAYKLLESLVAEVERLQRGRTQVKNFLTLVDELTAGNPDHLRGRLLRAYQRMRLQLRHLQAITRDIDI